MDIAIIQSLEFTENLKQGSPCLGLENNASAEKEKEVHLVNLQLQQIQGGDRSPKCKGAHTQLFF